MTISNSVLFKQAHAMTKQVIQKGDDYRATFGACLKAIQDELKQVPSVDLVTVMSAIIAMVTAKISVKNGDIIYRNNASLSTTYHTSKIIDAFMCLVFIAPLLLFFALGISGINAMNERNEASFAKLYDNDTSQTVTTDDSHKDKQQTKQN